MKKDCLYFGLHKEHSLTLEEIGEKFNLTRERVRQIKEKAIRSTSRRPPASCIAQQKSSFLSRIRDDDRTDEF